LGELFDSERTVTTVEIHALVEQIVSPLLGQHPEATIRTDVSVGEVATDPTILELVLEKITTHAVEHAGTASEVTIDATHRTGHGTLRDGIV